MRQDHRAGRLYTAILLTLVTLLPATNGARGQAATTGGAADEQWRREMEARMQRLEQENRELRKSLGEVEATQEAVRRDVAARGPLDLTLEPRPEQTTPPFFDVNKYAASGDFPGSIRIPGTNVSIQIGGFTQLDVLMDFGRVGSRDSFIPRTIPTDVQGAGETNFSARQTRLFIKTVTPTGWGPLTTYLETDFFGSDNNAELRLRHAYGEVGKDKRLLAGQTWSVFVDASVFPAVLDQQGAAGQMLTRRPQVRYTQVLAKGLDWAISLEDPNPDISNAAGVDGESTARFPALASNLRWTTDWGHLQVAGIVRQITFDPDVGSRDSVMGFGLNLTGDFKIGRDKILFQLAGGNAIADYMNDTGGAGLDGFFDGSNLKGLATFGGVIGYQHWWDKKWDSNFVYSYAWIENDGDQPDDAYNAVHYVAVNLRWHPAERVMIGLEYLYGIREDKDGDTGDASRVQMSFQYRF